MTLTDHDHPVAEKPVALQLYWLSAIFGLLTLPALLLDSQLAVSISNWDRNTISLQLLDAFQFAGSLPVLLAVGIGILAFDRGARRKLLRLATAMAMASLACGLLKAIFSRQRPGDFDLDQEIWNSFPGLFHSLTESQQGTSLLERSLGGFPSGHVTSAVVAAVGLGWLYPRGRWLCAVIALAVAAQRIVFEHHFLSDLCAATAIGTLAAGILISPRAMGGWFNRFEQPGK